MVKSKKRKNQRFPFVGLILFLIFMAFYAVFDNPQNHFFTYLAAIAALGLLFIVAPLFIISLTRRSGATGLIEQLGYPLRNIHAQSLEEMQNMTPMEFEHFVGSLFQKQGYSVTVTGKTGDNGIDIELSTIINGAQKRSVAQCKRYKGSVGESIVREFYGSYAGSAEHGYLVTTGTFTNPAKIWAQNRPLTLIDGHELVHWAAKVQQTSGTSAGVI